MRRPLVALVGVLLLAGAAGFMLTPGAGVASADTTLEGTLTGGQAANPTATTDDTSGATTARDNGLVGPLVIGVGLVALIALAVLARWRRGS